MSTTSTPSEVMIQSPSPSHHRERSLDDIVFDTSQHYRQTNHKIPKHRPAVRGAGGINTSTMNAATSESFNKLRNHNEQLQAALDFEENESMRLEKLVKEFRQRYDSSLTNQSKLEQDLLDRDHQIEALTKQLKETKRSKHELENTLAEEQMTSINAQQKWLDKEAEFEKRLKQAEVVNKLDTVALGDHHQQPTTIVEEKKDDKKVNKDQQKQLDRMKNELDVTRQQLELVSKEYTLRHEQVKQELEQVKEVNGRLQEENEGFQVVLAQKTIMGEFSLESELEGVNEEAEDDENDKELDDGEMKRRVYDLEFETKSLKNHNRALKVSMERLVQRLLEFRDFEQVVQDQQHQQEISPRSISLFHRRLSSKQKQGRSASSSSPLEIPKRHGNQQSISSVSSSAAAAAATSPSSAFQFPMPRSANRVLKPASTWSSMIFTGINEHPENDGNTLGNEHGFESPISSSSGTNTAEVVSSASSIDSTTTRDADITSILSDSTARRPVTHGQKKLRPLRLQSGSEPMIVVDSSAANAQQLQAPPSSASSWSFGLGSS